MLLSEVFIYILLAFFLFQIVLLYVLRWRTDKRIFNQSLETLTSHEPSTKTTGENVYVSRFTDGSRQPVSLVIPTANQAEQLRRIIPLLMEQRYNGCFEVIVADQKSTDFTQDYVEGLRQQYENLRYVQLPESLRHIALRKIAITLGVKAARNEWVIVVNPETVPTSKEWLHNFARYLNPELDFVSAYFNYYDDETSQTRRALFERIRLFNIRIAAWKNGQVVGCEPVNIALRKKWFLSEGGFSDSLNLPFGEELLFANHHASPTRSAFVVNPYLQLEEQNPSTDELKDRRVHFLEVQQHLQGYAVLYSPLCDLAVSLIVYLQMLVAFVYLFVRISQSLSVFSYDLNYIYVDLLFVLSAVLYGWGTVHFIGLSLKAIKVPKYEFYIWIYDLMYPFHYISLQFQRLKRRKEFVRNYM